MHVLCVSEVGKWTLSLLEKNRKFQIIIEKLWDKYCQLCSLFSCLVYSYTVVMFGILGGTQLQSLVSVIILDSPTHSPLYPLFLAYFAICIVVHCRPLQFNYKRELLVLGACFSFPFYSYSNSNRAINLFACFHLSHSLYAVCYLKFEYICTLS